MAMRARNIVLMTVSLYAALSNSAEAYSDDRRLLNPPSDQSDSLASNTSNSARRINQTSYPSVNDTGTQGQSDPSFFYHQVPSTNTSVVVLEAATGANLDSANFQQFIEQYREEATAKADQNRWDTEINRTCDTFSTPTMVIETVRRGRLTYGQIVNSTYGLSDVVPGAFGDREVNYQVIDMTEGREQPVIAEGAIRQLSSGSNDTRKREVPVLTAGSVQHRVNARTCPNNRTDFTGLETDRFVYAIPNTNLAMLVAPSGPSARRISTGKLNNLMNHAISSAYALASRYWPFRPIEDSYGQVGGLFLMIKSVQQPGKPSYIFSYEKLATTLQAIRSQIYRINDKECQVDVYEVIPDEVNEYLRRAQLRIQKNAIRKVVA